MLARLGIGLGLVSCTMLLWSELRITPHELTAEECMLVKGGTCYVPGSNSCPAGAAYSGCPAIQCPGNNLCPNWPDVYGYYKSNVTTYFEAQAVAYTSYGRIGKFLFATVYCADIYGCLHDCQVVLAQSYCAKDPNGKLLVGFDARTPSVPDPNSAVCDDIAQNGNPATSIAQRWLVQNGGNTTVFQED